MSEFLVEVYVSRAGSTSAVPAIGEISAATEQLASEGRRIHLVRSIFVPEDETCFYLFQAQTADLVREAAARAGLCVERVTEAVSEHATHLTW